MAPFAMHFQKQQRIYGQSWRARPERPVTPAGSPAGRPAEIASSDAASDAGGVVLPRSSTASPSIPVPRPQMAPFSRDASLTMAATQNQLERFKAEAEAQRGEIERQSGEIERQQREIERQREEITEQEEDSATKDEAIEALLAEVEVLEGNIGQLHAERGELPDDTVQLQEEVRRLRNSLAVAQAKVRAQERDIAELAGSKRFLREMACKQHGDLESTKAELGRIKSERQYIADMIREGRPVEARVLEDIMLGR